MLRVWLTGTIFTALGLVPCCASSQDGSMERGSDMPGPAQVRSSDPSSRPIKIPIFRLFQRDEPTGPIATSIEYNHIYSTDNNDPSSFWYTQRAEHLQPAGRERMGRDRGHQYRPFRLHRRGAHRGPRSNSVGKRLHLRKQQQSEHPELPNEPYPRCCCGSA